MHKFSLLWILVALRQARRRHSCCCLSFGCVAATAAAAASATATTTTRLAVRIGVTCFDYGCCCWRRRLTLSLACNLFRTTDGFNKFAAAAVGSLRNSHKQDTHCCNSHYLLAAELFGAAQATSERVNIHQKQHNLLATG